LAGEDLDKLNSLIIDQKVNNELFSYMDREKSLPTKEYMDLVRSAEGEKVRQQKEKLVKIPEEFYKDLRYKLDIVITGQYRDTAIESQTLLALIQASTTDPMLAQVIDRKKLVNAWLEAGGINPVDFEPDRVMPSLQDMMMSMPMRGAGGGVSKPMPMPNIGTPGMAEQTL
jgi:hypothetical protein